MMLARLTIKRAMLLVAVVGFSLGSWLQVRHWLRLQQDYLVEAWMNGMMEKTARANGKRTHAEWMAACREIDRRNRGGDVTRSGGNALFFGTPDPPELERRRADYYAKLRVKYELAARYLWLPVELTWSPWAGPSGMRVILALEGRRTFDEAHPPLARAEHPQAP